MSNLKGKWCNKHFKCLQADGHEGPCKDRDGNEITNAGVLVNTRQPIPPLLDSLAKALYERDQEFARFSTPMIPPAFIPYSELTEDDTEKHRFRALAIAAVNALTTYDFGGYFGVATFGVDHAVPGTEYMTTVMCDHEGRPVRPLTEHELYVIKNEVKVEAKPHNEGAD